MSTLLLVPLEDVVVFPNMNVTLPIDVGDEDRVLLVPQHENAYAKVGTVAEVAESVRLPGGGRAVSPYPWLKRARHLLYPGATARDPVTPLAIRLTGTVLSVSSGTTDGLLKIAVRRVKLPGLRRFAPGRSVVLDVPETATIVHGGGGAPSPVPLNQLTEGDPVTAWSTIVTPGLRSELARPVTLVADRLLYNDQA